MATKQERIRSLELEIEEQRKDHDFLTAAYKEAHIKNITFLAVILGLLGYLYGGKSEAGQSLKEKLFIPDEPYGVIICAISFLLLLSAFSVLLFALKPRTWSTAYDDEQDELIAKYSNYEEYLGYMKRRYLRSSKINCKSYGEKHSAVQNSFVPMLFGGILLLLLKTFGG